MKQGGRLSENAELVSFPRETTYSIGNVTYQVVSYFSEDGKSLPGIVKHTLLENIRNSTLRTFAKSPRGAV